MRNFRDLQIWQESLQLAVTAYELAKELPKEEVYGLRSQITRAAVSIASNIAEGCSRKSERDFSRFLDISLGSAFELETDLIICQETGLLRVDIVTNYLERLHTTQRRINALNTKLTKRFRG